MDGRDIFVFQAVDDFLLVLVVRAANSSVRDEKHLLVPNLALF